MSRECYPRDARLAVRTARGTPAGESECRESYVRVALGSSRNPRVAISLSSAGFRTVSGRAA
jgi:hypothetical protein